MPTILSHIAVPLAVKLGVRSTPISIRLLVLSIICCVLPDIDVIAFKFGIPYESQWGHRGFTHSVGFAAILGVIASFYSRYLGSNRRLTVFLIIFLVTFSHALLDAATNGGLGCALLWPFSEERYFLPWTPIQVSPIGIERFLTDRGMVVLQSELIWVWLPSVFLAGFIFISEVFITLLWINYVRIRQRAIETQWKL